MPAACCTVEFEHSAQEITFFLIAYIELVTDFFVPVVVQRHKQLNIHLLYELMLFV